jgi:hypothetical protein
MFPCNLGGRHLTTGYSEEIRRTSGSEGHLCLLAVRSVVEIDFTAVDGSQEQGTYECHFDDISVCNRADKSWLTHIIRRVIRLCRIRSIQMTH